MLAKAIATGFNCPFVLMPGSGFQQTFLGMDAVIVRWLARKAKKLAEKWGGQCIVFIDEIDAVGMRRRRSAARRAPTGGRARGRTSSTGGTGRSNPSGDMILETRAWRERLFDERAQQARRRPPGSRRHIVNQGVVPRDDGRRRPARAQPAARRHGRHRQPAVLPAPRSRTGSTRSSTRRTSSRGASAAFALRVPPPRPRGGPDLLHRRDERPDRPLDPALTRPGRMGRHVWLRTPTKDDRKDIFDLYIEKVAHEPELDTPSARRARAHHGRLLAGDDRAGLLDGAHVRAPRRPRALRLRGHLSRR